MDKPSSYAPSMDIESSTLAPTHMDESGAAAFAEEAQRISDAVNSFIQGKPEVVSMVLTSLLAGGHVLLEDVPGVGKTSLARSFAGALGTDWQRIQFTPDLLPGDVTGVSVFHQDTNTFVFHPGPIFSHVVLADEINRASPRTQSALLEVMEERTVTIDGTPLPVPSPFLVMATQNPIEMDGTYPLPEAQLDRFLVKTRMGYPDPAAELRVLHGEHAGAQIADVERVSSPERVGALIAAARTVHVAPSLMQYIVALVGHTRSMPQLRLGASPRGALGLLRASRVRAAMLGRPFVVPGDVQVLAVPVLAHRVIPSATFEVSGGLASDAIEEAVAAVEAPPVDASA